jgi:hypothetical protein
LSIWIVSVLSSEILTVSDHQDGISHLSAKSCHSLRAHDERVIADRMGGDIRGHEFDDTDLTALPGRSACIEGN